MEADLAPMICPICLDSLHRPHSLQPCQHLFCDPCLRRLAEARIHKCPVCRSPIKDCHLDQELHDSIEDQHQDLYIQRQQAEMNSGIWNLPLPPVLPPVGRTFAELFNEPREWPLDQQLLLMVFLILILPILYIVVVVVLLLAIAEKLILRLMAMINRQL